ncbi:fibronectin type III domain-containing protein [Sphingomonas sp. HF-S4]|uniref:Fibronectin type III domain-containing protein n=1 Tax=Sphingomonas agrestis TaxID=3080540 RepID=A0ABU3Y586_9SPHN|nr:fibronectin type III domain-containing protein [Sphingomonas sp. HF-S4]MDV3456556.1 fibronectin type III domain-containing protein [Sphingomonas sp. HF-S4]
MRKAILFRAVGMIAAISALPGCDSGGSTPAPTPTPSPSATSTPTPINTNPPTAPGKVTVDSYTHNRVTLSWTAGTDDVGPVRYAIIRSDKPQDLAIVSDLTYTDTTAQPINFYTYNILSVDSSNNRSAGDLSSAEVTTLPTPTPTCPETTVGYPGPGGTGQTVGFQGSESALKPVGPDNLPAGTSWEASSGILTVKQPNVHLTDVIVRGGIKVVAKGVFTLTNSVMEFQKNGQGFECSGDNVSSISECRLTGNTFRRASDSLTGNRVAAGDTSIMTVRCNYLSGTSLSFSESGSRIPVNYNWIDGSFGIYNTTLTITHNRGQIYSMESKYGASFAKMDGNYFGGRDGVLRTLWFNGVLEIFRNNVIARPNAAVDYCAINYALKNRITDATNNFVGDALGNATSTPLAVPAACREFEVM